MASTSVTQKAVRLASSQVAARLKPAGFKRQGLHLNRRVDELFHAVHFQASRWGSATEGSFTVNLIVASPVLYEEWYGTPFPANPASAPFPVQMRIGHFMPRQGDHWWDVHEDSDLQGLAAQVADAVQTAAEEFFGPYESSERLLQTLRRGVCPGCTAPQAAVVHMLLANSLGHQDEAEAAGRLALNASSVGPFRKRVLGLARRLGLQLA